MGLTAEQLRVVRTWVGTRTPSDAELDEIFDRRGSSLSATVEEVLKTRYADLVATPATFSVSGEYSQSTIANMKALEKLIAAVDGLDDDAIEDGGLVSVVDVGWPYAR